MDRTSLIAGLFSDLDRAEQLALAAHDNRSELLHLSAESLSLVDTLRAEGGLSPIEETQLHSLDASFTTLLGKISR